MLQRINTTYLWPVGLCLIIALGAVVAVWPRYEFRARVPGPDGSQALMVYVSDAGYFVAAPGDWAYKPAYAYLVDDAGEPIGTRLSRNCHFQIGDLYAGKEYRADWSPRTVEISKFSRIDRETGRADCQ